MPGAVYSVAGLNFTRMVVLAPHARLPMQSTTLYGVETFAVEKVQLRPASL